jgi:hypothetical protein
MSLFKNTRLAAAIAVLLIVVPAANAGCREQLAGLSGEFEVTRKANGRVTVHYIEKDSLGNPVDKGILRAMEWDDSIYIDRYWVDGGGGYEDYGRPGDARKPQDNLPSVSLRNRGMSKLLFEKLLATVGPRKIVSAELAYTNIEVVSHELRRLIGLEPVREIKEMNAVKVLIPATGDGEPGYTEGYEFNLLRQAIAPTPFMKVWANQLGYTEVDEIKVSWHSLHWVENQVISVTITIRKPN